jgi:hypothetical protein
MGNILECNGLDGRDGVRWSWAQSMDWIKSRYNQWTREWAQSKIWMLVNQQNGSERRCNANGGRLI